MISLAPLKKHFEKPLAILGLGKSGMPVFDACKKAGIECVLWDDKEEARKAASEKGAAVKNFTNSDMSKYAALCMSPGVPLTHKPHPAAKAAQEAGVEILGDIELFHRAKPDNKTIGVTGTNGKSTTTALIGHILKEAKVESATGGNIGEAALTLPDLSKDGVYVLELSSYQLDLCPAFAPDVSVLLNLSPDHLDRHGDMAGYAEAKERIFRGKGTASSGPSGVAVIGIDDDHCRAMAERVRAKGERAVVPVSCKKPLMRGVYTSDAGILFDGPFKIVDLHTCPNLRGMHNWQNAAMAYAACRALGIKADDIVRGLHSFPGLAHRQSVVTVFHGITYINDSKATNDQAASMALGTYAPIYWIAGGKPKDGGYAYCEKHLNRVRHAFLIGEAEDEMAKWLEKNKINVTRSHTLEAAVKSAHQMAQQERLSHAVVLLSPACASFDQFKNFEHRGEVFTTLVKSLTHVAITTKGAHA